MIPSNEQTLFDNLVRLEQSLHQPEIRKSEGRLEPLLHPSFLEFGRSGTRYSKTDIIEALLSEGLSEGDSTQPESTIWSQNFELEMLSPTIALLTYKSALMTQDAQLSRHTLRTSIWEQNKSKEDTSSAWQIRFHQGTATKPFEKASREKGITHDSK